MLTFNKGRHDLKFYILYSRHEAHGSNCSPENWFQLIHTFGQSYDYTIMIKKNHYLLASMVGQSLVEIGQVILEKIFKIFVNVLLLFPFYLHSVKSIILYLNKPKFPLPKDSLCQVWVKLAPWFWRRFLNFVNVFFCYFVTIFPLEKGHSPSFEKKNPKL